MRKTAARRGVSRLAALRKRWIPLAAVACAAYGFYAYLTLPDGTEYRTTVPRTTAMMHLRSETRPVRPLKFVPVDTLPRHVLRAVIAAEDANFLRHGGFDFGEMWHAVRVAAKRLRLPRGASTITQQLARNLYLGDGRSPVRKLKEAVITARLERKLGKKRILELYLNVAEWAPGVFGIGGAAFHYFRKPASALSARESALLAAVLPNPLTYLNPSMNPARVEARRRSVERKMGRVRISGL